MAIYAYVISPVLRSGFIEDDRFDSIWAVNRKTVGVSGFEDGVHWTQVFVSALGRFHPLAHVLAAYSFEITTVQTYKLISFLATLAAVYLVALFLILWTGKKEIAFFFLIVLSSVSQFKITYDPILGFGLQTKMLVILLGIQLLVLAKIKRDEKPKEWVFVLFLALLICSNLYHEISVVAFVALIPLASSFKKQKRNVTLILIGWTFISYWIVRIALYFSRQNIELSFYSVQKSPIAIVKTYLQHLSGLVPFASTRNWEKIGWGGYWVAVALVVAIGGLGFGLVFKNSERDVLARSNLLSLGVCGVMLVLLPGSVSALSAGRAEIGVWWDGYIDVWVMQIGLSICGAAAIYKLRAKRSRGLKDKLTFTVVCTFLLLIVPIKKTNDMIVDQNPQWDQNTMINGWEREQTLRAIRSGFLDSRTDVFQFLSLPPRPWMSNSYLETFSSRVIPISNPWERFGPMPTNVFPECHEKRNVQVLGFFEKVYVCQGVRGLVFSSSATSFRDGYSITGQPVQISISGDPLTEQFRKNKSQTFIKSIRLFLSGKYQKCKAVSAIDAAGMRKEYLLIKTSTTHNFLINEKNGLDPKTLKLDDCA